MAQTYRDLILWSDGITLVEEVYTITKLLPSFEQYGLSSQVQRAAVSIPSNIAEGFRRRSPKDFIRFLLIARGSCAEVDTQLEIIDRIYPGLDVSAASSLLDKLSRGISSLIRSLTAA